MKALILAGRSEARVKPVVDAARAFQSGTNVVFLQLDLASLASVRAAAHKILADASIPRLDILINNAGISGAEYRTTSDGIEEMFAVCHVGHWLLTSLLMPKLVAAPEPRVVNLTSTGHNYWDGVFEDYNFQRADRPYSHTLAYGQAKAANIVFTKALVQRFGDRGLKAYSVQPGWVETNLTSSWSPEQLQTAFAAAQASGLEFGEKPKTLEQGCSTTLVAALDPNVPNGAYLDDCKVRQTSERTQDPALPDLLWQLTEKIVGEKFWSG